MERPLVVTDPPHTTTQVYRHTTQATTEHHYHHRMFFPRMFNEREYYQYRHIHGMPDYIPQLTPLHYICMMVPVVLFLVLYLHHRESNAKDLEEERQWTNRLTVLVFVGAVGSLFVMAVHLQLVPPSMVRKVFPQWKQPAPLSTPMKILIIFIVMVFIVYPTVKFFRKGPSDREPKIHRLLLD